MKNRRFVFLFLSVFASLIMASCAPTYPREKMVEGVKQLCKKEYGVDVEVKIVGNTLGVRMPLKGLFDVKTLQVDPKGMDKITGVMLSVSRVALSSDKSIEFYTIIATDENVPGAEIAMTRYVLDLRRYFFEDISRGEFTKRMVLEVRFNPQGIIDTWLGGFTLKETNLTGFMCEQATRNITDEFRENKDLSGKFKVSSCKGTLKDKVFKFTVDISREGLPMSELIHGTAWHDKVLEICLKNISHVISAYDFMDFEKIEVLNTFDNKVKEASKGEVDMWRKRRIKVE